MLRLVAPAAVLAAFSAPAQAPHRASPPPDVAPFVFERNGGRYDPAVAFVARTPGFTEFLTHDASWVVASDAARERGVAVRTRFVGARPDGHIEGIGRSPTLVHHLIGADPRRHSVRNETFARVVHADVWDGIDMVHLQSGGRLRYDFVVAPGADPHRIELAFDGVDDCRIAPDGSLVLPTALGTITHSAPTLWQEDGAGQRTSVEGRFELRGHGRVGFAVDRWDPTMTLVIDPVVAWASLLGGSGIDAAHDVAMAPGGEIVVVGRTDSPDLPTTPGAFQGSRVGARDAFVGRLDATGNAFVWCTYLGGTNNPFGAFTPDDIAYAVALRSDGSVAVGGRTNTGDFPVTPGAYQPALYPTSDSSDSFVTVLAADGASLVWSTFFGGSSLNDRVLGIAIGPGDDVYIAGETGGGHPVTPGAWLTQYTTGRDSAMVARFRFDGVLTWSTYIGTAGAHVDEAFDLAVDAQGRAYVAGTTEAPTMPAPNGFATQNHGSFADAFLARLSSDGSNLEYATFIGDSGSQSGTYPPGLAVLDDGRVWFTTWADNGTFATTPGAFQTTSPGSDDAVLLCIDTNLSGPASLLWATYLGGSAQDFGRSVIVAADGTCAVAGQTLSTDFPTAQAWCPCRRQRDLFVSSFDATGSLLWSTFYGDEREEPTRTTELYASLAGDPKGAFALAGTTDSPELATAGAAQSLLQGQYMGFVAKFAPTPATPAVATARPGCQPGAVVPGSLTAVDPRPTLGSPFRVSIDDPTNAAGLTPLATFAFWVLSAWPMANHPCGALLPGFGPTGGPGELLIDLGRMPVVALPSVRWPGPGSPAQQSVTIPCLPITAGVTLYTQVIFFDSAQSRFVFGEALDLLLGY